MFSSLYWVLTLNRLLVSPRTAMILRRSWICVYKQIQLSSMYKDGHWWHWLASVQLPILFFKKSSSIFCVPIVFNSSPCILSLSFCCWLFLFGRSNKKSQIFYRKLFPLHDLISLKSDRLREYQFLKPVGLVRDERIRSYTLGWTRYFTDNCCIVDSSRNASSAIFALNSLLNVCRVLPILFFLLLLLCFFHLKLLSFSVLFYGRSIIGGL